MLRLALAHQTFRPVNTAQMAKAPKISLLGSCSVPQAAHNREVFGEHEDVAEQEHQHQTPD